ncbi:MAG TPA: ankyrin repeat domain-containing protein [Bryobacteraceae bacterium]|nr:ankyrin repeat domain-containing protein [Bryobacteraceae bacterium]
MNTTDLKQLPARPNLEQYRKQAKDLATLVRTGDAGVLRRVNNCHPHSAQLLDESPGGRFALADAQLVIAREYGFESWSKFVKHIEGLTRQNSPISRFELAAEAIVGGDAATLESLLREHPELVRARSTRVHRAALLHYVGANGLENYRQKSPKNAAEIAELLLSAGAEVDTVADIYGKSTTLGLVATSIHPKRAGVQIPVMELLLDYGAAVDGVPGVRTPLVSALHNGRPEAAEFLARRGAQLDLEAAAGVGRLDVVERFFHEDGSLRTNANKTQMELGFLWACEYGRNSVVEFLLNKGVDLQAQANTGLTGLHWAVVGGQAKTVQLLLERGPSLQIRNVYGATALGQALWSAINGDPETDYVAVIEMLIRAGARIEDGSLAWLAQQGGGSLAVRARLADVLRSHGAQT